jgi:hypothetical protein
MENKDRIKYHINRLPDEDGRAAKLDEKMSAWLKVSPVMCFGAGSFHERDFPIRDALFFPY